MSSFMMEAAATAASVRVQPGVQSRSPLISGRPLAMFAKARSVEVPAGLRPPRLLNRDAVSDSCGVLCRHEHHQLHDPSARKVRPMPESAVLASPRVTLSASDSTKKVIQVPQAHVGQEGKVAPASTCRSGSLNKPHAIMHQPPEPAVFATPRLREEGKLAQALTCRSSPLNKLPANTQQPPILLGRPGCRQMPLKSISEVAPLRQKVGAW